MRIVYTVGYEGTDIERFVATLKAVGVQCLADVRAIPNSRKKGFSKRKLAARLEAEGIEYMHFQALGDPKPGREAARSGHYDLFRAIYDAHLDSDAAQASIRGLTTVAGEMVTCLLCFERDPTTCHRSVVAEEMSQRVGLEVFNLYGDDPERYVRNSHKLPRYDSCEGASAA
ncbi:DUF488 domain-containing protein [Hoeflea sp. CAU 1731]